MVGWRFELQHSWSHVGVRLSGDENGKQKLTDFGSLVRGAMLRRGVNFLSGSGYKCKGLIESHWWD